MRKATVVITEVIILAGVILVCLLALVKMTDVIWGGLESSTEGQAKVMANMIATSVATMSSMDAGRMEKSFSLKEPLTLEIYNSEEISYLKVTYDEKNGKTFEIPLLVKIDPVDKIKVNSVRVEKGEDGKIYIRGDLTNLPLGSQTDVGCIQPSTQDIQSYITAASVKYAIDKNIIKAVIMKESSFMQCRTDGSYVTPPPSECKGECAIGLMQLLPSTAQGLGVNPKNAQENVEGGTKYIKQLRDLYNGDQDKAIAAYFGGSENLKEIFKNADWKQKLPKSFPETYKYLTLVNQYKECYDKNCVGCKCDLGACLLC
jgi:hypothetical protein